MPGLYDCLPAADLDILGHEDGSDYISGNAILAELAWRGMGGTDPEKAALALEDDQLAEMAAPAMDLLKLTHKLAMAVRLGGWCLDKGSGSYPEALYRLLASALSDVIVLRQAELRRREILAQEARP